MTEQNKNIILYTEGLCRNFGSLCAVSDVSISVPQGQMRAVIGPNGAGKSTLMDLIIQKTTPSKGKVFFCGQEITGMPTYKISNLGMSKCFQITQIFSALTVFENVRMSLIVDHKKVFNILPVNRRYLREETMQILSYVHMEDKADIIAKNLSYGDQRRLEIAITLAKRPKLMILDEPAAGVARAESYALMDLIRDLKQKLNMTMMFIEHDMDIVWNYADEISVLNLGKLVASGTPDEIRNNDFVQKAYMGGGQ